jgi:hypothetical protein
MQKRERNRTVSIRFDDHEVAQLHALARAEDEPIGRMVRRWLRERYTARFGTAAPPATRTRFGDDIKPAGDR